MLIACLDVLCVTIICSKAAGTEGWTLCAGRVVEAVGWISELSPSTSLANNDRGVLRPSKFELRMTIFCSATSFAFLGIFHYHTWLVTEENRLGVQDLI